VIWPALALGAGLTGAWLALDPHTPDLAGQVYRVRLFDEIGFGLWDTHWYAGHALPAYSLLLAPLASALGLRLLGALCALASTLFFSLLVGHEFGGAARWGACVFAIAAVGDVWIGRIAFALGVCLALASALALSRARIWPAALLAALCAAASPVAGALLALAGFSATLALRRRRHVLVLALPPAIVTGALALLFAEGGIEPYPLRSFLATVLVLVAVLAALPAEQRLLRVGGAVYLAVCVLSLLVHTPMGSNVERYGVLLAGPLLLCARPRVTLGSALALILALAWIVWGPVRETRAVAGGEATDAAYYVPLERFLAARAGGPVRVEVPLTRSHWEAALLAPRFSLARGWEKQLEERYDAPLLSSGLDAAAYARWLREQAVGFVALPDAQLDPSSAREGRLIRAGLPYLREVFASAHWRVFAVLGATPLLSGSGRLLALGHEAFSLRAYAPGSYTLRVHFTRYWTVTHGRACVAGAPGGWTRLRVLAPGTIDVGAGFSLARALGGGGESCGPRA
jgi:hypothetical protein